MHIVPSAAVIIPHFNDVTRLGACLAALMPQRRPGVEIIVVDNGSSQSLAPVRAAWPGLRIVIEPQPGAAAARNRGVAETTAAMLIFLDSDCIPAPDWLARACQHGASPGVTGGAVAVFHETPRPLSGAQAFEAVFAFDNRAYVETKGFSVTANLVTQRDVFDRVGPFRPGVSEDLDWCRRATAAGARLRYADDLRVGHPSRGDWAALRRKWLRLSAEGFAVNGTTPRRRLVWGARALLMPISILAHAPRLLRAGDLSARERAAGLLTLARLRMARAGWMLAQALGRSY